MCSNEQTICTGRFQRRIQSPVEHLQWRFFRQQLTCFNGQLLLRKAPSQMFDMILNTSLVFWMIFVDPAYVCVCLRPSTMKASSVWNNWNASEQINHVMLKTCISSARSLHRYFRMKLRAFLTSHFILFTHQQRAKPRLNQCASRFLIVGPSFTIIRRHLRDALHRTSICLWRLHSREGSQSNYKRLK